MNDDALWQPSEPNPYGNPVVFSDSVSDETYTPGEPIDMSQLSLGPRYSSEDMYRDMGIERPPLPDIPWSDTVRDVTITIGESEKP